MTELTLIREISKYIKIQFISDTKLLPEDECDGEAKHILSLVKQRFDKAENPYPKTWGAYNIFEKARQLLRSQSDE